MTCYKCGEPVIGDNLQCEDCKDACRHCGMIIKYCECEREQFYCTRCWAYSQDECACDEREEDY